MKRRLFWGERFVCFSLIFFSFINFDFNNLNAEYNLNMAVKRIEGEKNIQVYADMLRPLLLNAFSETINRGGCKYRTVKLPPTDHKINTYLNVKNLDMANSYGNIILYGTFGNKFSVNSQNSLNLTLENGSSIKLKNEEVTLKPDDVINIIGKNNTIEVSNIFNISGNLLFDSDSQLIIKLITDDAHIVVADNIIFDLESNTEFKITGDGLITFGNNSAINLKGSTSCSSLYPSFILDSFAKFELENGATGYIKGVGKIIIQNGGVLCISGYSQNKSLNIGVNITDNIDFYVKGNGMIRLEGEGAFFRTAGYSYSPINGYYGNLSFEKGTYSLMLKQGGTLYIGDGGWLEFGSILSEVTSVGYLNKIYLGPHSNFCLNTGGLLSFADNDFVNSVQLKTIWISDNVNFFGNGGGLVEYIARVPNTGFNYQGFVGTLQRKNFEFKNSSGLLPKDIVKILVNQSSILSTAILYMDNKATNKIRLKNGAILDFVEGDVLIGEDLLGQVIAISATGKRVLYKLNGTRV